MTRRFVSGMVPKASLESVIAEEAANLSQLRSTDTERKLRSAMNTLEALQGSVARFEDHVGVSINEWRWGNILAAIELVKTSGAVEAMRSKLAATVPSLKELVKSIEEQCERIPG